MSAVALLLGIPMLASVVSVDVMSCVTRLPVADEALLDQGRLLASRRRFLVDSDLPLMVCWLMGPFYGRSLTVGSGAFSLLRRRDVE